jgi:ribosomal protein S18 acetylase RimI-like enzyme
MSSWTIDDLHPGDYEAALALWSAAEGVRANESPEEFARILVRNPGLSAAARADGRLVGAVLCCHDGRRGYLYHLAVAPQYRRLGIGLALVERCLAALRQVGIARCSIHVIVSNDDGEAFWRRAGWQERTDLKIMAKDLP